jgi:hypothetical protein
MSQPFSWLKRVILWNKIHRFRAAKNQIIKLKERYLTAIYAPETPDAYNIVETIRRKVGRRQCDRIVLNLDDSQVSQDSMIAQLKNNPIANLQEIIIVSNGSIIEFFPFDD